MSTHAGIVQSIAAQIVEQTFAGPGHLERKLADFQAYYNHHRTHSSLGGDTPAEIAGGTPKLQAKLKDFRWQTHCQGLYQLPAAA